MTDWKDRLEGGVTASLADYSIVSGTAVTILASNPARIRADLYVTGATQVHLGYGVAATSTLQQPIASQYLPYVEVDYRGAITGAVPSGNASSTVRVREISSP